MRFGLIITAAVVYLAVLGCVIFPAQGTGGTPNGSESRPFRALNTGAPLTGLPYKGIAMQIQRTDWTEEYKKSVDEIAAVGAGTVLFVIDARHGNGSARKIFLDMRMKPTPALLAGLVQA